MSARRRHPGNAKPRALAGERRRKGVAMLLVLIGLAVLALVANEARYNSMVELRLARNQRDEVRAYYLAQSGIGMSRLVLKFQKQLDQIQIPNLGGMLAQLTGGAGGAGGGLAALLGGGGAPGGGAPGTPGAAAAPPPQSVSIQLWRMAKIDCHMLEAMIPPQSEAKGAFAASKSSKKLEFDQDNPELAKKQQAKKFGGVEGCFDTKITDEEERINVSKLDAPAFTALATLGQLTTALNDKKYEFLFEREDSNRIKVTPNDIAISMRDWVDEDETGSALNLTGSGEPFIRGFSDENGTYARYETRYQAKNARFDSLDELFLVHGINDKLMAAFKDRLTVYPDVNSRLNINSDDPLILELAIRSIADPQRPDPRLLDPIFIDTIIKRIRAAKVFALFGMGAADFANIVASSGVAVNPTVTSNVQGQRFIGDRSSTYRIQVTGTAGDVSKTLTAVVRLDDGLGRLVYWREE